MATDNGSLENIDWSLTTWEGARREQIRRWSNMHLTEIVLALEEMQALAEQLKPSQRPERESGA